MAEPVKRRPYASPRRAEQAAETRLRILRAAQARFERDGYAATSMAAIARDAGVAPRTVYLAFETKSALLRALWHRVLRGEDASVPVGEQPWYREVLAEPDPERRLRLNMRNSRAVKERAAGVLEVIRAAAPGDPEIGALWARIQAEFHENQRVVAQSLADDGALARDLDADAAADLLWALNHPSFYALLAGERGWSADRYERRLGDLLCRELLGRGPTPAPSGV